MIKHYSVADTVEKVLIGEMGSLINCHQGSNYIKFINIAVGIEFLGACMDSFDFSKPKKSEERFNKGLKLFPKKYHKHSRKNAKIYFFRDFRCGFIHQLRPLGGIVITHRDESKREGTKHLQELGTDEFVLVLEELFEDFKKACGKLITLHKNNKLPTKKVDDNFIYVKSIIRK